MYSSKSLNFLSSFKKIFNDEDTILKNIFNY